MKLIFTVDVDRDAAWPKKGSRDAISKHSKVPTFKASQAGFFDLLSLVERLRIPTIFFFETATALRLPKINLGANEAGCHGLDHEDFTGESTGHKVPRHARRVVLGAAKRTLERIFETPVLGFRAPYLHADSDLLSAVREVGFHYDSSLVRGASMKKELPELWLPRLKDDFGNKMFGYLWPLMEEIRTEREYVAAIRKSRSPYVVLATHSWHTHQTLERVLSSKEAAQKVRQVKELLSDLSTEHEFVRSGDVLIY